MEVAEPHAAKVKYFTDSRLLQRDIQIILEGASIFFRFWFFWNLSQHENIQFFNFSHNLLIVEELKEISLEMIISSENLYSFYKILIDMWNKLFIWEIWFPLCYYGDFSDNGRIYGKTLACYFSPLEAKNPTVL